MMNLTDLQICLLRQYWLDFDEDLGRKLYREEKARQMTMPRFKVDDLIDDLGYTEEEAEAETRGQA
jgi:hypothetical protein